MVDFNGPGIDAPNQVLDVGKPLLKEEADSIRASHALVAIRDNFIIPIQLVERGG